MAWQCLRDDSHLRYRPLGDYAKKIQTLADKTTQKAVQQGNIHRFTQVFVHA